MRAAVDSEREADPAAAVRRAIDAGAEEVVVLFTDRGLDPQALGALRSLGRVRVRATIATLGDNVRGVARACALGLPVDVVLPIGEGLRPAAGRLHGLARAAPGVGRYLVAPVPDRFEPLAPAAIEDELEAARLAAAELGVTLSTDDDTRIDTELQAVLAGIKPVIRLSTEGTDEETLVARYARFGLVACAGDGTFIDDAGEHGRRLRLVYVARSIEIAEHVRGVEAKTFAPRTTLEAQAREYRDLGVALGYPRCCVDAYVERVIVASGGRHGGDHSEAYLAARGAWHASPSWQLNHLLFETGDALITFTPCSYVCAAAMAYADGVVAHVDQTAPLAAARLRRRLAVDVAVDRRGARVVVEFAGEKVVSARPRRTPDGALVHPLDVDLARQMLGENREDPAPVVARFGHAALG